MDKLLIAGVDSVVGGNLAAWLSSRWEVAGLSWEHPLQIAECRVALARERGTNPQAWQGEGKPQWVVFCGPSAESSWEVPSGSGSAARWSELAAQWARAARDWQVPMTLIS
ncbi:MAG: hypothetical protein ACK5F7_22570, partial [Planctomycetaceae bacterium]